ncbi:MAG: hypothetical protein FJ029_10025 [Actinobacteria bacterium]|nr:hypothetical protein [Actinomycetota bacterium]
MPRRANQKYATARCRQSVAPPVRLTPARLERIAALVHAGREDEIVELARRGEL